LEGFEGQSSSELFDREIVSLPNDKRGEDFTLDEMWFQSFKKAVVLVAVGTGVQQCSCCKAHQT